MLQMNALLRYVQCLLLRGMKKEDNLLVKQLFNYIELPEQQWREFIGQQDNPQEVATIKKQTMRGRPAAGNSFIEKLGIF